MNGAGGRPPSGEGAAVSVVVTTREIVVPRGTATTIWYVEVQGQWRLVRDLPGARAEEQSPPAGTVWRIDTHIEVAPGTRLKRVESGPAKEAERDPLKYLERGARLAARATRESLFVVESAGRLTPEPRQERENPPRRR